MRKVVKHVNQVIIMLLFRNKHLKDIHVSRDVVTKGYEPSKDIIECVPSKGEKTVGVKSMGQVSISEEHLNLNQMNQEIILRVE